MNNEQVREIALEHGVELKEQADGTIGAVPYVRNLSQTCKAQTNTHQTGKPFSALSAGRPNLRESRERGFAEADGFARQRNHAKGEQNE